MTYCTLVNNLVIQSLFWEYRENYHYGLPKFGKTWYTINAVVNFNEINLLSEYSPYSLTLTSLFHALTVERDCAVLYLVEPWNPGIRLLREPAQKRRSNGWPLSSRRSYHVYILEISIWKMRL